MALVSAEEYLHASYPDGDREYLDGVVVVGVPHIIQMGPEDRTTFVYVSSDLVRRDLTTLDMRGRVSLPFDSRELRASLDGED